MKNKPLPSVDILWNTITKTIRTAWNINNLHENGIKNWLNNFTGEAQLSPILSKDKAKQLEQQVALFLLNNFVYYNELEIKHLIKLMFEKYIHYLLIDNGDTDIEDSDIDQIIKDSAFSPLGNKSESSSYMLYLFRQINELSKRDFEEKNESKNIVFVDDFSITGSQANWYINEYFKTNTYDKSKKYYVLLMVTTQDAIKKIKDNPHIRDVISCIVMNDTSKVFSKKSIVFQGYSEDVKNCAKAMCEYYGERIKTDEEGATAFGFDEDGFLISTYYNTPNNTLPIFWSEENHWIPLFRRYNKKYNYDISYRLEGQYV